MCVQFRKLQSVEATLSKMKPEKNKHRKTFIEKVTGVKIVYFVTAPSQMLAAS
jgi:uncharacterized protein YbcI